MAVMNYCLSHWLLVSYALSVLCVWREDGPSQPGLCFQFSRMAGTAAGIPWSDLASQH